MDFSIPTQWEKELETQFLSRESRKICAYICSPLSADTDEGFRQNMLRARLYMYHAREQLNCCARAPHGYLPMLLCDREPDERALALWFGQRLLEKSDVVLVCGDRISDGMRGELLLAATLHMPIYTFTEKAEDRVRELIEQQRGDTDLVLYDPDHPLLGSNFPEQFPKGTVITG